MGDSVRLIGLASMHLIDTVMLMRSELGNFQEQVPLFKSLPLER